MTSEDFIKKANLIHNNSKIDYSQVHYIDSNTHITLICNNHPKPVLFKQTPTHHLAGYGCNKCFGSLKLTTEEFIEKAIKIHGKTYDYSKVIYEGTDKYVSIICHRHIFPFKFQQVPHSHLAGRGCPKCCHTYRYTQDEFLNLLSEKIGIEKYDFSQVKYIDSKTKIILIDKENNNLIQVYPNIIYNTCQFYGCITYPNFGYKNDGKASYCYEHRLPNMFNINKEQCLSSYCDTSANPLYEGYCAYCFHNLFPDHEKSKNYKTKENQVSKAIKNNFDTIDIVFDKRIDGGCSLRRPDVLIDMGSHAIVVEVDENQHRIYGSTCELDREKEIVSDLGDKGIYKKTVFIRINPDGYQSCDGIKHKSCWKSSKNGIVLENEEEWQMRINKLLKKIKYWISHEPDDEITHVYLFFDEK